MGTGNDGTPLRGGEVNNREDPFCAPFDKSRGAMTFRQVCAEMGLDVEVCRKSLAHLSEAQASAFSERWDTAMYKASGVSPLEHRRRKEKMPEEMRRGREVVQARDRAEMVRLYQQGDTQEEIAGALGVHRNTVGRALRAAGIVCPMGPRRKGTLPPKETEEQSANG